MKAIFRFDIEICALMDRIVNAVTQSAQILFKFFLLLFFIL